MIKFEGVMPALVTPLTADEKLNVKGLRHLMSDLLSQNADGFYVGGATGEGINLTREVREELAVESVKAAEGKPCILHIAATNFNEACELAKQAEKAGAAAISAIPPLFFQYDEDDVYNYYKGLASCVNIPLMIYYNPNAGFKVNARFAARMFEVDNITSIKWTSSDYFGMLMVKELTHGEMNVINGPDEMLLMGLSAGADGGIGTTYNMLMPYIRGVYDNFKAGNIEKAREMQTKTDKLINVIISHMTIPATKAILEKMGYEVGNASFPMKRYTEEEKTAIYESFLKAGFER